MSTALTFSDWLQFLLSFALVIGLLLGLLWALKKIQNGSSLLRKSTQRMQTIETLSLGPRQKVVLIQVDGQDVLIGVTAHGMTALSPMPSLPAHVPTTSPTEKSTP